MVDRCVACLPFGSLRADWFPVRRQHADPGLGGILYSIPDVPFLAIPVIAAAAARSNAGRETRERAERGDA